MNADNNNSKLQEDEIQALSAIFGEEWTVEDDNMFSIRIRNSNGKEVYFQIILPESYPLQSPPIYQISAPWMSRAAKCKLLTEIEDVYSQNIGESVIYLWIDAVKNFIEQELCHLPEVEEIESTSSCNTQIVNLHSEPTAKSKDKDTELPLIEHGEPIIDRKSVFQAHSARVIHADQVSQVLEKLKENRKIASATHNIYAYRIAGINENSYIQDCEDDGETKAGAGLLHLLQVITKEPLVHIFLGLYSGFAFAVMFIPSMLHQLLCKVLDVTDVLIIVSRWYGGVHLGSDRFKHINNAARNLFNQLGYIKNEKNKTPSKGNKK